MRYTTLPNTDLRVSVVAMGCWALSGDSTWGPQDEAEATAAVHAALDAGINFFDTAEMYGAGLSEQRLGQALLGRRDRAVIASKFNAENMAPKALAAACERSLRNLQTDRIDLYQIHWASHTVPLADTWAELLRLRDKGKVRAIGVCNFGAGDLSNLLAIDRPATDQLPYGLLSRAIEYQVLPRCRQEGVGVLCYSPLLLGLLSGKYADAASVPDGRARTRHFSSRRAQTRHGEPGCERETFAAIARIREISGQIGRPMADVAVAWLLHQPGVTGVLAGIRSAAQAQENAVAADLSLSEGLLAALTEATEPVKQALGANPDLWQRAEESRIR